MDGTDYKDVWNCYNRNGEIAECKFCKKTLACKSSSTSGLHRHLVKIHNMNRKFAEEGDQISSTSRRAQKKIKTVDSFFTCTNIKIELEEQNNLKKGKINGIDYKDVWNCYNRNGDNAECKFCNKTLACKSSSTSGLHRHLENIHNMKRKFAEEGDPISSTSRSAPKKIKTVDSFFTCTNNKIKLEEKNNLKKGKMNGIDYKDVWNCYNRNGDNAECKFCNKTLACKSSSTSGLHRHLKIHNIKRKFPEEGEQILKIHNIKRKFPEEGEQISSISKSAPKKIKTVNRFFKCTNNKTKLEEIVAKLAAKDGIPILTICNSDFIRRSLKLQGFSLPQQPSDIMTLVENHYNFIKNEIISKIKRMKSENNKFAITLDEWTSFRNRRYLNIHIYYNNNESDNLGLQRIEESCPADKILQLVDMKLKEFGLDFKKDIVSATTDGASVMRKFGELSPAHLQMCYSHAIHLAVMEVFYIKKADLLNYSESNTSDESNEELETDDDDKVIIPDNVIMKPNIYETIRKIRKIVLLFKRSPDRNNTLQNYVKVVEKNELQLLLDCRTRWNTIVAMIERFLRIKDPIFKALNDLNMNIQWLEDDQSNALNILKCLNACRIAIEALSRLDANLLTAEGVFKFLFKTLSRNSSTISNNLLEALKMQIAKRRDASLLSLLKFLQDSESLKKIEENAFFNSTSKYDISNTAKSIMNRLFNNSNLNTTIPNISPQASQIDDEIQNESDDIENELSFAQQLEKAIRESLVANTVIEDDFSSLSKEINIFEATGIITANLQMLKNALFCIRPTSTQNKRNFSISGIFVSKHKTRLDDKSINNLCMLKSYFNKNVIE